MDNTEEIWEAFKNFVDDDIMEKGLSFENSIWAQIKKRIREEGC